MGLPLTRPCERGSSPSAWLPLPRTLSVGASHSVQNRARSHSRRCRRIGTDPAQHPERTEHVRTMAHCAERASFFTSSRPSRQAVLLLVCDAPLTCTLEGREWHLILGSFFTGGHIREGPSCRLQNSTAAGCRDCTFDIWTVTSDNIDSGCCADQNGKVQEAMQTIYSGSDVAAVAT